MAFSALGGGVSGGGGKIGSGLLSGGSPSLSSYGIAGLQGGATALSMMGTLQAGSAKAEALREQAADDTVNSSQAIVSGQNQILGLKQKLLSTIGSRTAAAGASGVDVGQGVVQGGNRTITQNALDTASLDTTSADIASRRQQVNALAAQVQANDAETAANAQAGGQLLGGILSIGKLLL